MKELKELGEEITGNKGTLIKTNGNKLREERRTDTCIVEKEDKEEV